MFKRFSTAPRRVLLRLPIILRNSLQAIYLAARIARLRASLKREPLIRLPATWEDWEWVEWATGERCLALAPAERVRHSR